MRELEEKHNQKMERDEKKDKSRQKDCHGIAEFRRGGEKDSRNMDFSKTVDVASVGSRKKEKKKRKKNEEEFMEDNKSIKGESPWMRNCEKVKVGDKENKNVDLESGNDVDKKMKRRRKKANNREDSSSNMPGIGLKGEINMDERDEGVIKSHKAQRRESSNGKEGKEENAELQISGKRKRDRMDSIGSNLEAFETELRPDDQRRAGNDKGFKLEKPNIQEDHDEGPEGVKKKRKKEKVMNTGHDKGPEGVKKKGKKEKVMNTLSVKSVSKDGHSIEKSNGGKLITKGKVSREGPVDNKKWRSVFENTGFEFKKDENHNLAMTKKSEEVRIVKPISNEIKDGVSDAREKLTTEDTENLEDFNVRKKSSTMTVDKKKNRREKEKKASRADNALLSSEGISNKDGKRHIKSSAIEMAAGKTDKRTSSVRKTKNAKHSTISEAGKTSKRVTFSGHVEVFPPSSDTGDEKDYIDEKDYSEDGFVRGKRFSLEEDEMIKEAFSRYTENNHLGEEGVHMILNCKDYPQIKGCWREIAAALPWRPLVGVYQRAHTIFERNEVHKWKHEEYEILHRYYQEHGPKWRQLADLLGKNRKHVKDAWRRSKLPNARKGHWSQEEYQSLFDLVNMDLRMKAFEEKKTQYGMLRDNISWEAISKKLSTRYHPDCCLKWYRQLTSPLVDRGLWADCDDYLLMDAGRRLLKIDASCKEDVDWDNLLEHRSGEVSRRRWDQMTKYIGGYKERSFMEQVEVLSARYCPDMFEYRSGSVKEL